MMIDHEQKLLLLLLLGVLALTVSGCASGGGSNTSVWRPNFGFAPNSGSGAGSRSWNGPQVQPGTGLQPTPAMTPPAIQPGPMLPNATGRKFRAFPESAANRRRRGYQQGLPPVVPHPPAGAPIAQQELPSASRPAELSGEIEIVPGPTLRARRARMDRLPTPSEETPAARVEGTSQTRVEELPPPGQGRFEELPPPGEG